MPNPVTTGLVTEGIKQTTRGITRSTLAKGLFNIAQSIVENTRDGVALLDRAVDVNRALDELFMIVANFRTEQDFESPEAFAEIDAWEAKHKNALIYDSKLVEWLENQLSDDPYLPAGVTRRGSNAWSQGNKSRLCMCVARILTLRQMRTDACAEELRDLTEAQEKVMTDAMKRLAAAQQESARKIEEKGIRIKQKRDQFQKALDRATDKLDSAELDVSLAKSDLEIAKILNEMEISNDNIAALQSRYELLKQRRNGQKKVRDLTRDMLAVVDINDKNYLALVQRGKLIDKLLEQAEHLKKTSQTFTHHSKALKHQMQGRDQLTTAGLLFAGGIVLGFVSGGIGAFPLIGGALSSLVSTISTGLYLGAVGYGIVGTYNYKWQEIHEYKKVLTLRLRKSLKDAPGGSQLAKGTNVIMSGIYSAASYFKGAAIQMSQRAYEYLLDCVESDVRARMQEEFDTMAAKEGKLRKDLQQRIQKLESYNAQYESAYKQLEMKNIRYKDVCQQLETKIQWQEKLLQRFQSEMERSYKRKSTSRFKWKF